VTNEEMERTMQFVVQQRSQFASDIQRVQEVQARSTSHIQQLAADLQQLREAETTLLRAMTAPVRMQGQTHERVSRLETAMAELAERVSAFY
jgi:septal ring factor EnvC (AmiA/AmiB activator)